MQVVSPIQIASYAFCPYLLLKGQQDKLFPGLSVYESHIKKSILLAEEDALYKNTIVTVKRLSRAWDKVWWPYVATKGIKIQEAEKVTIKAMQRFMDYCKYEITDYLWPTIGTEIDSEMIVEGSVLKSTADIIKVNLESKKRNTVIVGITNRTLSIRDAAFDNFIKASLLPFYSGKKETMTYINMNISEKNKEIETKVSTFQPEDMEEIEKATRYITIGIRKRIKYMNSFSCKGCNICPEFK